MVLTQDQLDDQALAEYEALEEEMLNEQLQEEYHEYLLEKYLGWALKFAAFICR
jgi:hypothetical protein